MASKAGIRLHRLQAECFRDRARFRVVVSGRRWGKCLAPETRVALSDGSWKSIVEVKPGDLVPTLNEDTYAIEHKPVKHVVSNGVKETVIVKTAGRRVRCTPNHPFLVNNTWVEAKDIKPGDLIAVARELSQFGEARRPDHEVDFLAIWLAEGTNYVVSNTTPEILDALRASVAPWGLEVKYRNGIDWVLTDNLGGAGRNHCRNGAAKFLKENLLFGKNSKTKFIPAWVYTLPQDQLARFLNLFMACDGSINNRSKTTWAIEVGLANERMVRQLAELFLKFGIRGQISLKIHNKCGKDGSPFKSWRFIASDSQAIKIFCKKIGALSKEVQIEKALTAASASSGSCNTYLPISYDQMVDHLNYEPQNSRWIGRKTSAAPWLMPTALKTCLNNWRKQTPERMSVRRFRRMQEWHDGYFDPLADGDVVWEEIVSIECAEKIETFDLSIEDNHNFFAEGLCTHNTTWIVSELIRAARMPKQNVWYVAPTYRMAKQIVWRMLLDTLPKGYVVKSNETNLDITLVNGSIICLRGADKPDTLRGVELHFLAIDECQDVKPEVWKTVLRPTLAKSRGRAIFTGTPKSYNFLYELYTWGQKDSNRIAQTWKSWQFKTITSPFIPKSEILAARADMDERSFRQEFEATFETMSGRVYYNFDRADHLSDKCVFNPSLPIWVGQDFNINPMSSVIIQRQGNGELWVVDEIYLHNSNTLSVCDELEKRYFRYLRQITLYPDPAGANRQSGRGESDLDIFRERGIKRLRYRRKHPAVADRVNAVNKMLRTAEGKIRLRINPNCRNLIMSLEQTLYKPNSPDIDKKLNVEHITDALGYLVELEYPRVRFVPAGLSI